MAEAEVVGIADYIRKQFSDSVSSDNAERNIIDTLEKVLDEYFSTKDLRQKTELSRNEILFLTKLRVYQHMLETLFNHNCDYVKIVREEFMSLQVSKERKGRREITNIFQALLEEKKRKDENEGSILEKMFKVKTE